MTRWNVNYVLKKNNFKTLFFIIPYKLFNTFKYLPYLE